MTSKMKMTSNIKTTSMVISVWTKWTKMLNQKHFFKRGSHIILQKLENVEYQGEGVVNVCYNSSYLSQLLLIYNRNKRWKPCEPNVCGSTPVQLLNIFSSKMSTGSHLIEIFLNRFEPVWAGTYYYSIIFFLF